MQNVIGFLLDEITIFRNVTLVILLLLLFILYVFVQKICAEIALSLYIHVTLWTVVWEIFDDWYRHFSFRKVFRSLWNLNKIHSVDFDFDYREKLL